ncbi:DUF3164 family protein [Chromobacterium vaccinii]|uniref:DUF3164 family protein n=1 Tax=Chromobacterium vaccinii TaxID=1108595 RepID=UPI001C8BD29B|nr:DUF3164 family protein [Chromobacterium vaccinii]MBX9347143.1 DUF3164 family protein [Chromobacterium vaccinii]MCD4501122.1 DUF3164 family protein [Chromobacterium vaccinii]
MNAIPDGYKQDGKGRLVPINIIKPIDIARDEFVAEALQKAVAMQDQLAQFKAGLFADIDAFVALSAERYKADVGGEKGNVTLTSFDGNTRVLRAIADTLAFDEGLLAAKTLIDECVQEWTEDARPEVKALIADAFQVDKAGNISTGRVLGLRRLGIQDEKWQRAMRALSESVRVQCSKAYVRIERRSEGTGKFEAVRLDLAGV